MVLITPHRLRSNLIVAGQSAHPCIALLQGMLEVYAFLMTCIRENRPEIASWLFVGRLTLGDVIELAPYFETGYLFGPHYLPDWASDLRTLASSFAFNGFFTRMDLTHLEFSHFISFEEQIAEGEE